MQRRCGLLGGGMLLGITRRDLVRGVWLTATIFGANAVLRGGWDGPWWELGLAVPAGVLVAAWMSARVSALERRQ